MGGIMQFCLDTFSVSLLTLSSRLRSPLSSSLYRHDKIVLFPRKAYTITGAITVPRRAGNGKKERADRMKSFLP